MNFEIVKKNLEEKGFKVSCFASAKEATDYIDTQIDGKSVGFGGSMTLEQMGLYERLAAHNDVRCYDCKSPDRICRGLSVLWSKPMTGEIEVVLIGEKLGY